MKDIEELTSDDFPPSYSAQRLIKQIRELPADDQRKVRRELSPVVTAARAVVEVWYAEHDGRTEQSEATAPMIEALRAALEEQP